MSYKGNQWLKITTVFDCEEMSIGIKILEFNYHGAHYLKPIIAKKKAKKNEALLKLEGYGNAVLRFEVQNNIIFTYVIKEPSRTFDVWK